jgi:phosphatidylglycerophosphate synthase
MKKLGSWDGDDLGVFALLLILAAIVGIAAWVVIAAIRADSHVEYCYVQRENAGLPVFDVYGYRSWRSDIVMAVEPTAEAAQDRLTAMCPGAKQ